MDHQRKLQIGQRYSIQSYGVCVWIVGRNRTQFNIATNQGVIGKRAGNRQTIGATFFGAIKKTETVQQYQKSKKIVGHGVDQVSDCQNNAG